MNKEISKEMILFGLQKQVVQIIDIPDDNYPACQIGELWFYFIENIHKYRGVSAEQFVQMHSEDQIADMIIAALNALRDEVDEEEYLYYYWYLAENGIAPLDEKLRAVWPRSAATNNPIPATTDDETAPESRGPRTKFIERNI